MKKLVFFMLLSIISSCSDISSDPAPSTIINNNISDTLIGRREITNEVAGSAYRKRAIAYFVIRGKDTSQYSCIFSEAKDNGRVSMDLHIPYSNSGLSYRERKHELRLILPEAAEDFNFDSLSSVSFGRFILSGDLAAEVTKEYLEKFGADSRVRDYKHVAKFLLESKLASEVNELFNPYSLVMEGVSIEKVFFATKRELYQLSKVESDEKAVPDKILDCILYVKLKKV